MFSGQLGALAAENIELGMHVLAERKDGEAEMAEVVKPSKRQGMWAVRFGDGKLVPKAPDKMRRLPQATVAHMHILNTVESALRQPAYCDNGEAAAEIALVGFVPEPQLPGMGAIVGGDGGGGGDRSEGGGGGEQKNGDGDDQKEDYDDVRLALKWRRRLFIFPIYLQVLEYEVTTNYKKLRVHVNTHTFTYDHTFPYHSNTCQGSTLR